VRSRKLPRCPQHTELVPSSFSDGLLINSLPLSAEASSALSNLELTELLELGFLGSALKVDNALPFNRVAKSSADMKVAPIGRRYERLYISCTIRRRLALNSSAPRADLDFTP